MAARRVLALLGAVAMVAAALALRAAFDDDDGGGAGRSSGERLRIACAAELAVVCEALDGAGEADAVVEDAGETLDSLAAGRDDIDAWLTLDPWPAMADVSAGRNVAGDALPVAATPLHIAAVDDRATALAPSCGGEIGWRCLVDAVGRPWPELGGDAAWGTVRIGVPRRDSALGMVVNGNAVSGYMGRTDFATNDLDADAAFAAWFARLTRSETDDPFVEFITQFPARYAASSATGVDAGRTGSKPARTITPNPPATVLAVLAPLGDIHPDDVAELARSDALRRAFDELGWPEPAPDVATNLPGPGVLVALRSR